MNGIDVNCLLGHWPFRKIRKNTFDDLKRVHAENNISYGYVSSLNSIFYNDPFEGEQELHEIIKDTNYKHVLTVNPTLPGFMEDIKKGITFFGIKGVRIYPGYHEYKLGRCEVEELCGFLKEVDLPLFISRRMEDERLEYLMQSKPIPEEEILYFVWQQTKNKMVFLTMRPREILAIKDELAARSNVFFDTSGLKDWLFTMEKMLKDIKPESFLYGSLYPLFCLKSSLFIVEKADIEPSLKQQILNDNFVQLEKLEKSIT